MGGEIESASRRERLYSSAEPEHKAEAARAPAGWNADYDKIPGGIRAYDAQLFSNPAVVSAWPTPDRPTAERAAVNTLNANEETVF